MEAGAAVGTLAPLLCQPAPDAHVAAQLGAVRAEMGVPQAVHTDETAEHLRQALRGGGKQIKIAEHISQALQMTRGVGVVGGGGHLVSRGKTISNSHVRTNGRTLFVGQRANNDGQQKTSE